MGVDVAVDRVGDGAHDRFGGSAGAGGDALGEIGDPGEQRGEQPPESVEDAGGHGDGDEGAGDEGPGERFAGVCPDRLPSAGVQIGRGAVFQFGQVGAGRVVVGLQEDSSRGEGGTRNGHLRRCRRPGGTGWFLGA